MPADMTTQDLPNGPDTTVNARDVFGVDFDMDVPAFSSVYEYVPV